MMLSSLPPLGPQDAHTLFHPSHSTFPQSHPSSSSNQHPSGPHQNNRTSNPSHHHSHRAHTLLSTLHSDETAIHARKAAIRRFGAGWLRPPGIPKTLQGLDDERTEREEAESAANREFALQEAQAAAEAEAMEREQEQAGIVMGEAEGEGGEQGMEERDLDEEVPDADAGEEYGEGYGSPWTDEEDMAEDEENAFENGRSGLPSMEVEGDGHYAEGEEGGRDLDEDVPEAGSYQHTDTELEEDSSDGGDIPVPSASFREVGNGGAGGVLGSSVFGSSPALRVPRGARRSGSGPQRREN